MNNDKELLELAAKAAGIVWFAWIKHGSYGGLTTPNGMWNPLTDDGDALRLAVKLHMKVYPGEAYAWEAAIADYSHNFSGVCDEEEEPDTYAATRLAIVRAAAEVGKAL